MFSNDPEFSHLPPELKESIKLMEGVLESMTQDAKPEMTRMIREALLEFVTPVLLDEAVEAVWKVIQPFDDVEDDVKRLLGEDN